MTESSPLTPEAAAKLSQEDISPVLLRALLAALSRDDHPGVPRTCALILATALAGELQAREATRKERDTAIAERDGARTDLERMGEVMGTAAGDVVAYRKRAEAAEARADEFARHLRDADAVIAEDKMPDMPEHWRDPPGWEYRRAVGEALARHATRAEKETP